MTQASENKFLWKKLTALFVAFVLCLTMVQMPTQEAMAAAKDVKSIIVPKVDGITWYDDTKEKPLEADASQNYWVNDDGDHYTLIPNEDYRDVFLSTIKLYAQTDAQPTVTSSDEKVKPSVGLPDGNFYPVSIGLRNATSESIVLSVTAGTKQYKVSYPYNDDGYEILGGLEGTTKTYDEGTPVSFQVKVLHPERQTLTVKAGGTTLQGTLEEESQDTYTYTIDKLERDTAISISVKNRTFQVSLPGSEEGYTVTPGISPVEYGGSYTFYVTPKTGYQAPTVEVNGSPLASVGNNQYVITNITKDQTITIVPAEKEQFRLTFNQGEGYYFTTPEGTKIEGSQQVAYGENFQFKVVLNEDYTQSNPIGENIT